VGHAADVCVFDPEAQWVVAPSALRSQGKNTPFLGYEMRGKVRATLVEGHVVFEAGSNGQQSGQASRESA
jgi:dihydroorotase